MNPPPVSTLFRAELLGYLRRIHRERGITLIIVSHSMEEVAAMVHRIVVMDKGSVYAQGIPREIFSRGTEKCAIGLDVPPLTGRCWNCGQRNGASMRRPHPGRGPGGPEGLSGERGEAVMFKGITIGQYCPGDSFFHRLEPRIKIGLITAYVVSLFLLDTVRVT